MLRYIEEVGHVLLQNHLFILVITQTQTVKIIVFVIFVHAFTLRGKLFLVGNVTLKA